MRKKRYEYFISVLIGPDFTYYYTRLDPKIIRCLIHISHVPTNWEKNRPTVPLIESIIYIYIYIYDCCCLRSHNHDWTTEQGMQLSVLLPNYLSSWMEWWADSTLLYYTILYKLWIILHIYIYIIQQKITDYMYSL